eukprot:TRINITY_DN16643_c0_g1_i1.p1 TRINITY_DN16643_c0_g1~~TRINITY_DN16643_c0_g1_i1.p1  ORF type:complete len:249 (+),score=28.67 TRINITY_DN16643_c0_g1_i1:465-1211(+)
MPKSRGYVQSSKPHCGLMPDKTTEWKVFEETGWEVDRTIMVSVTDVSSRHPESGKLTKMQHPAPHDSRIRSSSTGRKDFSQAKAQLLRGVVLRKFSAKSDASEHFFSLVESHGAYFLSYHDCRQTNGGYDKRVPLPDVVSLSLGPFESRNFIKGPTETSDPGLCVTVALEQGQLDLEALNQQSLVSFVLAISVMCEHNIRASGKAPLTSVENITASQKAVRELWAQQIAHPAPQPSGTWKTQPNGVHG